MDYADALKLGQSRKVKMREQKRMNKYKAPEMNNHGICDLCSHNGALKVKAKYSLCCRCYEWCRSWVINTYGSYYQNKMPEAMIEFLKPVKCKFCNDETNRVDKNSRRIKRFFLCKTCEPIWKHGYATGRKHSRKRLNMGRPID